MFGGAVAEHVLARWAPLLTRLGDAGLLVLASAGLTALLIWRGERRAAALWCLLAGGGLAVTILLKIVLHQCGRGFSPLDLMSPSGHTSFAMIFYGSAAMLIAAGRPSWQRLAIFSVVFGLILAVGGSRVLLGAHSPAEVVVGLLVGGVCALLFGRVQDLPRIPQMSWFRTDPMTLVAEQIQRFAQQEGGPFCFHPLHPP